MKIIYFLISFIQFFLQKMNKKLYNINYFEPAIQNEEYPLKLNPILNIHSINFKNDKEKKF